MDDISGEDMEGIATISPGTDDMRQQEIRLMMQKSAATKAAEFSSLLVIMIAAIVANMVVIIVILRVRRLRQTPHNLLIFNLAVADLGVALTSMPFSLISVFDGQLLMANNIICQIHGWFAMVFAYANFPIILCIALDRVLIITRFRQFPPSRRRVYAMIFLSWLVPIGNASFPSSKKFMQFAYLQNTLHCSPVFLHRGFTIAFGAINYGAVVATITVCYVTITYTLWMRGRSLREHQASSLASAVKVSTSVSSNQQHNDIRTFESTCSSEIYAAPGISTGLPITDTTSANDVISSECSALRTTTQSISKPPPSTCGQMIFSEMPISSLTSAMHSLSLPQSQQAEEASINISYSSVQATQQPSPTLHPEEPHEKSSSKCRSPDTNSPGPIKLEVGLKKLKAEKRVALMGFLFVLTTLICWVPYAILHSDHITLADDHWFGIFTMWLGYCNAFLDPLIYSFMNRRVRQEVKCFLRNISNLCSIA